jgi:hypothetical protein
MVIGKLKCMLDLFSFLNKKFPFMLFSLAIAFPCNDRTKPTTERHLFAGSKTKVKVIAINGE